MKRTIANVILSAFALWDLTAHAAEIKVISSVGMKAALEELKGQFEAATPHKLAITFGTTVPLKRQIEAGETFDVVILTPAMIEDLVKQGKVAPGTPSEIAKVGVGVAGRAGAPRPDIGTADAFKRTLLNAKSIVHSKEGASGTYMASLIERLGIAAEMKPKTVLETRSGHTAVAVVEGKAELGFTLISEILPVSGAELIGPLPAELQSYVVFTAGVSPQARDAKAAKGFISYFATPSVLPVLKAKGMEPAGSGEKIVLDGSTGMLPLAKILAAAYQQKSSDPRVDTGSGLGTGARLRALAEDKIQIALASHGIKPEDVQKGNLRVIEVAKGAIVFGVNAGVPIAGLTEAQVCDIYGGKVTNWQSLGGGNNAIVVLTRPPTEVDPEVIRAKIGCFKDLKEAESVKVMARGGDMAKALAETPYAIGMTSMTVVEQSAGKVRALTLNDIAPTAEYVRSGRYFLTRDFLFVIKAEPTLAMRKFVDFVLSPDGDRVILANGAVPLR